MRKLNSLYFVIATDKKMILHYDKGRLWIKSYGLDRLVAHQNADDLVVKLTVGSESSMASLKNCKDKRFIVERTEKDVDCKSHEVKGLKVEKCKGNIQIKNFPS